MNWKRGMGRVVVVGLGLVAVLALTAQWHDQNVLWVRYQDGSAVGQINPTDNEEGLNCIQNFDGWLASSFNHGGGAAPIVVDRNVCPTVVSMEWRVEPSFYFYSDPFLLVLKVLFLAVPLFFAGRWAVRGFRADKEQP